MDWFYTARAKIGNKIGLLVELWIEFNGFVAESEEKKETSKQLFFTGEKIWNRLNFSDFSKTYRKKHQILTLLLESSHSEYLPSVQSSSSSSEMADSSSSIYLFSDIRSISNIISGSVSFCLCSLSSHILSVSSPMRCIVSWYMLEYFCCFDILCDGWRFCDSCRETRVTAIKSDATPATRRNHRPTVSTAGRMFR